MSLQEALEDKLTNLWPPLCICPKSKETLVLDGAGRRLQLLTKARPMDHWPVASWFCFPTSETIKNIGSQQPGWNQEAIAIHVLAERLQ